MMIDASISRLSAADSPPVRIACSHCGLPVPKGLIEPNASAQYCCDGCRQVHGIIQGLGLTGYYALRAASGQTGRPAAPAARAYSDFDNDTFQKLYVRDGGHGTRVADLYLPAMHCLACVWLVERVPRTLPGVIESRVNFRQCLARVVWNPETVSLSAIARRLDDLGYAPAPARSAQARAAQTAEDRRHLARIGIAAACAGNVMLMALALYAGAFSGMDDEYRHLMRWLSMGVSLVSIAWPGSVFFRSAVAALRTRSIHMDVPIAIGLGAGALWGVICTVLDIGEAYFDSLSVLVFALLVGRWIQRRRQRWSTDALELLYSLTPSTARRMDPDGSWVDVPAQALMPGDTVEVRSGETVPADGLVLEGQSRIDQSLLTGESAPEPVKPTCRIAAGAVNLEGAIRVRVEACGEATRVGRLMALVEECAAHRAPIVRLADRLAAVFTVCVLLLAALTAMAWLLVDPLVAVDRAVTLLIVTCPCALGLATPLAMTAAIGRAAHRGMLIKGSDALQVLAGRGIMLLDKTGTLTHGRLTLAFWLEREPVGAKVAALERTSAHAVAKALVRGLARDDAERLEAVEARQVSGAGIEGWVGGTHVAVGSARFMESLGCTLDPWCYERHAKALRDGFSPVLAAVDHRIVAVGGIGDPVRREARDLVAAVRALGWQVAIVSGDHPSVVQRVARQIGIEESCAHGAVSPEAKVEFVRAHARKGTVLMVGDGVNDAAALAAASVGIAVKGGSEASLAAADVYLAKGGVADMVDLLCGARRTMRVIRRNLAVSLAYNVAAGALAVSGAINPLLAAVLMPLSSLTVVAFSYGSRTFQHPGDRSAHHTPRAGKVPRALEDDVLMRNDGEMSGATIVTGEVASCP